MKVTTVWFPLVCVWMTPPPHPWSQSTLKNLLHMFKYASGESPELLACALGDAQGSHLQSYQSIFGLSIIQNIRFSLWGDSGDYLRIWRFRKALAHRWKKRIGIEPMAAGNSSGGHGVLWRILMFSSIYLTPKLNGEVTNPKVKRCGGSSGYNTNCIPAEMKETCSEVCWDIHTAGQGGSDQAKQLVASVVLNGFLQHGDTEI